MSRFVSFVSVLSASLAFGSVARADGTADAAASATIFREARALMEQGNVAAACDKFEAANKLLPTPGTLLSLADCREKNGQTATAYGAFQEAGILARQKGDEDRDAEAKRRGALLEPLLARIALDVAHENRGTGITVKRDGIEIPEAGWDAPIPVDPGAHTIEASKPGTPTWSTTVTIAARPGVTSVQIPPLGDVQRPAHFWTAQRIAGLVVGTAGLVTLGVSFGFGASAKSSYNASLPYCLPTNPDKCYAQGVMLRNNSLSAADVATGVFVGGAVALVAGVVTFAVPSGSPKRTGFRGIEVEPIVGSNSGALVVRGAW
jgi:tetratricopeptide (TPR) repeat protein